MFTKFHRVFISLNDKEVSAYRAGEHLLRTGLANLFDTLSTSTIFS